MLLIYIKKDCFLENNILDSYPNINFSVLVEVITYLYLFSNEGYLKQNEKLNNILGLYFSEQNFNLIMKILPFISFQKEKELREELKLKNQQINYKLFLGEIGEFLRNIVSDAIRMATNFNLSDNLIIKFNNQLFNLTFEKKNELFVLIEQELKQLYFLYNNNYFYTSFGMYLSKCKISEIEKFLNLIF
tara:strand:+ start:266 stop:832 length:567 start_codon:yes stop_codon:yes gene_type:complete